MPHQAIDCDPSSLKLKTQASYLSCQNPNDRSGPEFETFPPPPRQKLRSTIINDNNERQKIFLSSDYNFIFYSQKNISSLLQTPVKIEYSKIQSRDKNAKAELI